MRVAMHQLCLQEIADLWEERAVFSVREARVLPYTYWASRTPERVDPQVEQRLFPVLSRFES